METYPGVNSLRGRVSCVTYADVYSSSSTQDSKAHGGIMADGGSPPKYSAGASSQGNAGLRQLAQPRPSSTKEDQQRQELLSRFPVMQNPSVGFVFKEVTDLLGKISTVDQEFQKKEREQTAKQADFERSCERRQQELSAEERSVRMKLEEERRAFEQRMKWEREALEEEKKDFEEMMEKARARVNPPNGQNKGVVELNIGGTKFRTAIATLVNHHPHAIFPQLVKELEKGEHVLGDDRIKSIFIDRDPRHFPLILNYLRMGEAALQGTALHNATYPLLNEVLLDTRFYHLRELEHLIRWKMVALGDCLTFTSLVKLNLFAKATTTSSGHVKWVTRGPINLSGKNLTEVTFDCVHFQHPVSLHGSVLCGAVFNTCRFSAPVNLTDADLRGVKFLQCLDVKQLVATDISSVYFDPPIAVS